MAPLSNACADRGECLREVMADGEMEFALVDEGESISTDEDSRLLADMYE